MTRRSRFVLGAFSLFWLAGYGPFMCEDKTLNQANTEVREGKPSDAIESLAKMELDAAEVHFTRTRADNQYNRVVAVPDVTRTWAVGGRKDCLQHYDLPWVVNGVSNDIGPWDCTAPAGQGDPEYGCMAVDDCCTLIRGSEPVDDLGNGLGCKIQPLAKAYEEADPAMIISEYRFLGTKCVVLLLFCAYTAEV